MGFSPQIYNEINAAYHEAARKFHLSDSALLVLYTICSHGDGCLLQDICRLSGASKQTINSALRTLVFQMAAVLIFPLIWGIDGIWISIVAAECMAAAVSILFIIGNRSKYHY